MSDADILDVEDTVLCIDISRSMARRDLGERSRLEIVKDALIDFVKAKLKIDKRDRFAIVGFSTSAKVLLQLTNNEEEIIDVIKSLTPQGVSGLGEGVAVSLNILCHEILQEGQNVYRILIISDGKPWIGTVDPIEKAQMAAELGIIVDAIEVSNSRETWGENILESMTQLGTYHQAMSEELLRLPLKTLAHKKDVYDMKKEMPNLALIATPLIDPTELMIEFKESIDFYLGDKEPVCIICRLTGCGICNQDLDCFRICPYCKNYMHLCCVEKWSETSKMIEAQVFRCPHCLMLLRLPDSIIQKRKEMPPPTEETPEVIEEQEDKLKITSAFSIPIEDKEKPRPAPPQRRIMPSSASQAKIGEFIREAGRVFLKELIKGEEKLLYLAWENWGSRNFRCNLMSGMNEKVCKEFIPIIDWEQRVCTGFKIVDSCGWLSNLSYEYGILVLNLDELTQWCEDVLKDLRNIKKLIEEHPEIEFTSDRLTDFELVANVKFDGPISIRNKEELEGNLLYGAVLYLHMFHEALGWTKKEIEVKEVPITQKASSSEKKGTEVPSPQKSAVEIEIDFDQMDESFDETQTPDIRTIETSESSPSTEIPIPPDPSKTEPPVPNIVPDNIESLKTPSATKRAIDLLKETKTPEKSKSEMVSKSEDEIIYRYYCSNCNKWFKSKKIIQQNCPSCSKPLKIGLYCPKCKKWYFVSQFKKYICSQCGNILQTND